MSAETFAEAYQAAIYKADGLAFALSEKPTGIVLFEGRKFAVITAHNPRSERLSAEENRKRHLQLEQDLLELELEYTSSTGESPDGSWIEEGYAVFDIELQAAVELGRKYGQHAILWGEGERVCLVWCETRALENFFARRVSSPAEVVNRFIEEAWNRQNLEVVEQIVAPDYTVSEVKVGPDGVRRAIQRWRAAFPDLHLEPEEVIQQGDRVAVLLKHTGRHGGKFLGLEATGRTISWTEAAFWTVEAELLTKARFIVDWEDVRKKLMTPEQGEVE